MGCVQVYEIGSELTPVTQTNGKDLMQELLDTEAGYIDNDEITLIAHIEVRQVSGVCLPPTFAHDEASPLVDAVVHCAYGGMVHVNKAVKGLRSIEKCQSVNVLVLVVAFTYIQSPVL